MGSETLGIRNMKRSKSIGDGSSGLSRSPDGLEALVLRGCHRASSIRREFIWPSRRPGKDKGRNSQPEAAHYDSAEEPDIGEKDRIPKSQGEHSYRPGFASTPDHPMRFPVLNDRPDPLQRQQPAMQSRGASVEAPGRQEQKIHGREERNHHTDGRHNQKEHSKSDQNGAPESVPEPVPMVVPAGVFSDALL